MISLYRQELRCLTRAVRAEAAARQVVSEKIKEKSDAARQKTNAYYAALRAETRAEIIRALKKHGRTGTNRLASLLGKERSSLFKHLREMTEDGSVNRRGCRMRPEWEAAR